MYSFFNHFVCSITFAIDKSFGYIDIPLSRQLLNVTLRRPASSSNLGQEMPKTWPISPTAVYAKRKQFRNFKDCSKAQPGYEDT